jgi:Mn2+/Fe2+ NRAMP family transporter
MSIADERFMDHVAIDPPRTVLGILRQLGPGLIIAGSIVGSGELIATTLVGAEAGFVLLWLTIIGCIIKVFVQIELGRYAIINGRTTLDALNEVPGPRAGITPSGQVNWVCWFWLAFTVVALAQVGGLIGGVGQALAIQFPLSESGREVNAFQNEQIRARLANPNHVSPVAPTSHDATMWAALVTMVSIVLLVVGRYGVVQTVSTALVATFTLVTVINLVMLQLMPEWHISWSELASGFRFQVPPGKGLATALAAFGIIGVGATELIQYPYWCLEKGYARWAGPRDDSPAWAARAAGWIRVLQWDAWCSMVVYTFTTIAFYLVGAAILGRTGLSPKGDDLVRTLGEMYAPVFGTWAQAVFLFGAFAVLYSTFFVAAASHARVLADAMRIFGLTEGGDRSNALWVPLLSGALPLLFLGTYVFVSRDPRALVLAGGFTGSLMLPILGVSALYVRYRRGHERLAPGALWDGCLWVSVAGLFVAGGWALYDKVVGGFL